MKHLLLSFFLTAATLCAEPCYELHALLQAWVMASNDGASAAMRVGFQREEDFGVLIRRSEIRLKSVDDCPIGWFVMFDPRKEIFQETGDPSYDYRILQDLYITYCICDGIEIKVGQFRVPTSAHGLEPAPDLWFPERSWIGWRFGDVRELGLAVSGNFLGGGWMVGVFNGRGTNRPIESGMQEIAGRVCFPILPQTDLAFWIDYLNDHESLNVYRRRSQSQGIDITHCYGMWSVRGEIAIGSQSRDDWGVGVQAALDLLPCDQVAFRAQYFKGHLSKDNKEWAVDFAYSHLFCLDCGGQFKFQVSPRYGQEYGSGTKQEILSLIAVCQIYF